MKKQFLELLIRECVKEVLGAFPGEQDTVGAPAPPAAGQGTADEPALPQGSPATGAPPMLQSAKGVFYVDPKKPEKPAPLQVTDPQDPGKLERELYRTAAKSGGPRVKVSSAALREVPKSLSTKSPLFLYIGKQNPDDADDDLYLLPAKSLQQAQQASVGARQSAEHPSFRLEPKEPGIEQPYNPMGPSAAEPSQTQAPDIDENANLRNMLLSMIKEAIQQSRK